MNYWDIIKRNYGVYDLEEQEKLLNAKVAIVGIGCDGGLACMILSRMGIGNLILVDYDTYEVHNINRQPMATISTIGERKVDVALRFIKDINPSLKVTAISEKLTSNNAIQFFKNCDVILQCVDDMYSRIVIHRAAMKLKIPSITMTGQPPYKAFVSTIMPDGPLYEELFNLGIRIDTQIDNNDEIDNKLKELKYERAKYAATRGAKMGWLKSYLVGDAGWAITPERAYLTGTLQAHEAIRIILGINPLAVAPKAIIIDLRKRKNIIEVQSPTNRKSWDYRKF